MKDNVIQRKSYDFALRIIKLNLHLKDNKSEYDLSRQILRSGTSIGANIEEAIGGQSKKDFVAKLSISYKEARETHYWLRLLRDSDLLEENLSQSLISDCEELIKLLTTILKSSKSNN